MDFLDEFEDALDAELMGAEAKVLGTIAETIGKQLEGLPLREALARIPADLRSADKTLSKAAKDVDRAAEAVEAEAIEANEEWAEPYYEASGATMTGEAAAITAAARTEAVKRAREALKTSVIGLANVDGTGFVPLAEAYRAVVTDVSSKMALGELTGEKAVSQAVRRLHKGGLRVVFDSERTMSLHSAVRMNVMDTFRRAMGDARNKMGEEFGADGVEVSAHGLCAEDHLRYQGRMFPKKEFQNIQDNLKRPIAEGYNCRHNVWPVILGISKPAYTEAELEELERLSTEKVSFEVRGETKTMTRYEFTQYQRALERGIRDARLNAYLAEKSTVRKAEADRRVRDLVRSYRTVSKQVGIDTMMERTKLYIPR